MHGPAESFTKQEVKAQMETVYFGPYRLIRAVVPGMRIRRRGIVVALGSGAGVDGRPSMGIYGAAKAALEGKSLYRLIGHV
jgi:NAD(P)-dependent dehydrogenase (short-subunit alcohol dehydrogenase family)